MSPPPAPSRRRLHPHDAAVISDGTTPPCRRLHLADYMLFHCAAGYIPCAPAAPSCPQDTSRVRRLLPRLHCLATSPVTSVSPRLHPHALGHIVVFAATFPPRHLHPRVLQPLASLFPRLYPRVANHIGEPQTTSSRPRSQGRATDYILAPEVTRASPRLHPLPRPDPC